MAMANTPEHTSHNVPSLSIQGIHMPTLSSDAEAGSGFDHATERFPFPPIVCTHRATSRQTITGPRGSTKGRGW